MSAQLLLVGSAGASLAAILICLGVLRDRRAARALMRRREFHQWCQRNDWCRHHDTPNPECRNLHRPCCGRPIRYRWQV